MNNNLPDITSPKKGIATVQWRDERKREHEAPATPDLLRQELYNMKPIRTGNRYPRQRNYHGLYFMESAGKHVWFESLLEESGLARLDMGSRIVNIASQPMMMRFLDGSVHYPDFLALHANHRQVVYDVKPQGHMTEDVVRQFDKTRAVAELVGWGYAVLHELGAVEANNLNWFRQFKHHQFHPDYAAVNNLARALREPLPVIIAAAALGLPTLAEGRSALFHLIWKGTFTIDLTCPLSDSSLVNRGER